MKIRFLGTAAAECFPAIFCNCKYCQEARRIGGKNIRTRSQSIINDELLIDLPADTYSHFLANGIEGDKIKYLLITHSHEDHFYYDDLLLRNSDYYCHDLRVPTLEVLCGEGTYKKIITQEPLQNINVTLAEPFKEVELGDYTITPLPARHMPGDGALIYIIKGDKTILYAHDTGYFYDEVFNYIRDGKIRFDMISFDCTNVDIPEHDEGFHMGIPNIERVTARLKDMDAVDDETILYINHFSHNANPIHEFLENRVRDLGYGVAYDGCEVEI